MEPTEPSRVAAPPPPDVSIRTMASDVKSLEQGETRPVPERVPSPVAPPRAEPAAPTPAAAAIEAQTPPETAPKPKRRRFLWLALGVVVVMGLGALGYFVVYPLFFGESAPPRPTPLWEPTPSPTPSPPQRAHRSFLRPETPLFERTVAFYGLNPDGSTRRLDMTLLKETLGASIAAEANQTVPPPRFVELTFLDADQNPLPLSSYLPLLAPVSAENLASRFEDDFTPFFYHDEKGVWPGYVAKLKDGAGAEQAKLSLNLETIPLEPFYERAYAAIALGEIDPFKDGTLAGFPARYAATDLPGAVFEYAWLDTYLLISTSYPGAIEAARRLGFE